MQPGDVFLVQTPIDKQHEIYTKRGFLPFDNHLGRINPDGYKPFYERRSRSATPQPRRQRPRRWMKPDESKLVVVRGAAGRFPDVRLLREAAAASPAHCRCKVYPWA